MAVVAEISVVLVAAVIVQSLCNFAEKQLLRPELAVAEYFAESSQASTFHLTSVHIEFHFAEQLIVVVTEQFAEHVAVVL